MGESRNELLKWINDLCKLNYTKLEQVGTGAAYCQIVDSIYRDVPLKRVKFNAKSEPEYLDNYKILNAAFNRHKIDKIIPTLDLVKLRMQDNLLFTQWLKKFWDSNFPGDEYDAIKRRSSNTGNVANNSNNTGINKLSTNTPLRTNTSSKTSRPTTVQSLNNNNFNKNIANKTNSKFVDRTPSVKSNNNALSKSKNNNEGQPTTNFKNNANNNFDQRIKDLSNKLDSTKEQLGQIQDERDFYYGKLQSIEDLTQAQQANLTMDTKQLLSAIEVILYTTQEGYEPADILNQEIDNNVDTNVLEEGLDDLEFPEDVNMEPTNNNNAVIDNDETF